MNGQLNCQIGNDYIFSNVINYYAAHLWQLIVTSLLMLKIILKLLYPDGISHFNENPIGSAPSCNTTENQNTTQPLNMSRDSTVTETEIPKNDKKTVDLKTQDSQLNSKQYPIPKKIIPPKYKSKRMKKYGNIQKIQFPGVYKMKLKPSQRRFCIGKFFQSLQTLEGDTEPSVSKILGNYFPRMNLGLPIPASTQESEDMTSCTGVIPQLSLTCL